MRACSDIRRVEIFAIENIDSMTDEMKYNMRG